jgi:hypothetical protein
MSQLVEDKSRVRGGAAAHLQRGDILHQQLDLQWSAHSHVTPFTSVELLK